jgi:hypothetical protein
MFSDAIEGIYPENADKIQGGKTVPAPLLFRAVLFLIKIHTPHGIIENCRS